LLIATHCIAHIAVGSILDGKCSAASFQYKILMT
jgi:hypothetical protein